MPTLALPVHVQMNAPPLRSHAPRVHDGSRISVFWPAEQQYYEATVSRYCGQTGKYTLEYLDGDVDDHAQLDGPAALTFSILAGRCSCCGSAALRDPGPMSNCTIPAGLAAVTAGAFNVACGACNRFFCALCLPGRKPVGCEAGDPMRFMRFRRELMYDRRTWYCPQGTCQQVRRADHREDVAAAAQAKDVAARSLELKRKRDDDAKKQNKAWDNLQAAVEKDQKALEKKQKKAEENLQAAIDKMQKKADQVLKVKTLEDEVVSAAFLKASASTVPLVHGTDLVSAVLQDMILQLRQQLAQPGQARCTADVKLPLCVSELTLDKIQADRRTGFVGSDLQLKWVAPLAAFDPFFDQPPTVDGMTWHDLLFTGWRRPITVGEVVHSLADKFTITYNYESKELKAAVDCVRSRVKC